jgi:hypothetical protein
MDQLARPAGGAEGDVVRVDGQHRQAASRGIERDPGSSDAEAHHQHIDAGGNAAEPGVDARRVGRHGRRYLSTRTISSACRSSAPTAVSVMVCDETRKP